MNIICIIPIKHNSERVPGKNFKMFSNKPLYWYIINTVLKCSLISKLVINTDSEFIKDGIKNFFNMDKIIIYNRPDHLKSGDTPVNKLLLDTIESLKLDADFYIQTHTTNPLLKIETIENCINLFMDKNNTYDSLFSVKKFQNRLYKNKNDNILAINHNINELIPTQDLETLYEENSCLYIFSKKILFEKNHRIGDNPQLYVMDDIESQDIDIESDFYLAEIIYNLEKNVDKILLITGCNGDIADSICLNFKKKNWTIIGLDIHHEKQNNNIDTYFECDLTEPCNFLEVLNLIRIKYGKINCFIHNAAIQICKPVWEMTDSDWENTINVNIKPLLSISRDGLDLLKKEQGNIISIASVHSIASSDKISLYSMSKSSLVGLTKNLAIELGQFKIRVNCVSPGAVNTKMLKEGLLRDNTTKNLSELIENIEKKHLLSKIGTPNNISSICYEICSNDFINGVNYLIDGGVSIKLSTE